MKTHFFYFKFILQFIIFSFIIFYPIYFIYKPQCISIFQNEQKLYLDNIKYNIEIKINTIKYNLSVITIGIKDNHTEKEITEYLNNILKRNNSFINIYYCDLITIKSGGMFVNVPKPVPKDFDQTTREWFNAAIKTNKVYISEPYIDVVTKKLAVAFAKAVYNKENKLKGVLGIDFSNMENIFIDNTNSSENINITTKNGYYIVHNDNNYILNEKYNLFNSDIITNLNKNEIDYSGNVLISNNKWVYLNKINNADWILMAYGDLNNLKNKFYKFFIPLLAVIIMIFILEILLFIYFIIPMFNLLNKLISKYEEIY